MVQLPRLTFRTLSAILTAAVALALAGCASGPDSSDNLYAGAGNGATLGEAINAAKMDAVRNAVIDLIGADAEAANANLLDEVLYSTRNPNAYVFNETLESTRKDGSLIDGDMNYELMIIVNVPAVQQTLDANGIGRAPVPGDSSTAVAGPAADPGTSAAALEPDEGDWAAVTPEEERFIRRHVETMTYMVYFANGAAASTKDSDFVMGSAVNQANSYLVSDGRLVVDADQVQSLAEDQRLVYEEETGQEVSLLQWVARRLNADVYIEIDARVTGSTSGDNHYGTADITLNMYDTSTAQVLGSVNRRSQNSFSRTSEEDAILNAVQSTVYQAMPAVVEMARTQMTVALRRGIRYEVTIQNPPDDRSVSRFRSALHDEVREVATVSRSPEEVLYEVFAIGSTDDIIDIVYEISDRVAGFQDLLLVISRGRALTFDAGY